MQPRPDSRNRNDTVHFNQCLRCARRDDEQEREDRADGLRAALAAERNRRGIASWTEAVPR